MSGNPLFHEGTGYARKVITRLPPDSQKYDQVPQRFILPIRAHLQALGSSGEPQIDRLKRIWIPGQSGEKPTAIFDHIGFHPDLLSGLEPSTEVDTTTELFGRRLILPLQFGDMSAGALHPNLNIALALAAEELGILCGTGEGGLLPELYELANILVQWASARWGVTEESITKGAGAIIKVGQGAKSIGGELPQAKLEGLEILQILRRFKGADAISPGVHEDIYSIEDLGRQIMFLQLLRRLANVPDYVGVKIVPGRKAGAIACGVGRMNGHAIIMDGKKAGTGATPKAVADSMGYDIELAVPMVDRILRLEQHPESGISLRKKTKIVGGGGISSARDLALLMALGVDSGLIGTAAMVGAGCVKKDRCNTGKDCPAGQTNLALGVAVDIQWTKNRLVNLVRGMQGELSAILNALGLNAKELVSRRDLVYAFGDGLSDATVRSLGIKRFKQPPQVSFSGAVYWPWKQEDKKFWSKWRVEHAREVAKSGLPFKRAMGSQGPPFTSLPHTITDHIVIDPAQVTSPQQDGYREPIDLVARLGRNGQVRLSTPILLGKTDDPSEFIVAAKRTNSIVMITEHDLRGIRSLHKTNIFVELEDIRRPVADVAGIVIPDSSLKERELSDIMRDHRQRGVKLIAIKLDASDPELEEKAQRYAKQGVDTIIVDGELGLDKDSVEIAVRKVHNALQLIKEGTTSLRQECSVLAYAKNVRDSADILKLQFLGADAVFVVDALQVASEGNKNKTQSMVNWLRGSRFEMKLIAGGAGINKKTSIIGNVDQLSTINLPNELQSLIDVKPGGMEIEIQDAA